MSSIKGRFSAEPLWLMDGSAFVFRGFYANQSMSRSDAMPTGAIHIVARLILRLIREEKPAYFCFILDGHGKNFRHELFPAYKANRSKAPEGLIAQIEPITYMVKSLGLHVEISNACEADDCIASLAERFHKERPVIILGADKDLRQCLNEQVLLWDPSSKKENIVTYESFVGETGLKPSQWPDVQALVGDSSDNIPGIPGIGLKTAQKLLKEYPSLEALRDNFASLPQKLREKFADHLEDMFLYRNLTTLSTSFCQDVSLDNLRTGEINFLNTANILEKYELFSIKRELEAMLRMNNDKSAAIIATPSSTKTQKTEQVCIFDSVAEENREKEKIVSLKDLPDCTNETVALLSVNNNIFAIAPGEKAFLCGANADDLALWLKGAACIITPDIKALWKKYPILQNILLEKYFDLKLAAYLLNPQENDLSWSRILQRYCGLPPAALPDAAGEALLALRLYKDFSGRLKGANLEDLYKNLEIPLIPVLTDMERAGICLDKKALSAFFLEVQVRLQGLLDTIYRAVYPPLNNSFNIRSARQIGQLLFERLNLPRSGSTHGGQARTDQESLEKLQGKHPIIEPLLAWKKLEKMRSTYLEPLPRLMDADGRIRTTFNQTATATGRLSSSNPNLQNIPVRGDLGRRMRTCFTGAPGMVLISADYSQIELRVLAHLSQEPALLEAFHNGEDIHARTAGILYNKEATAVSADERRNAKTINFGLIYGMGPQSLAKSLHISTNAAKDFISQYFAHMQHLKNFYENAEHLARERGYVSTLAGRIRFLPDLHSGNNQLRSQARRQAINTVVQGSAADIIKLAMLAVYDDKLLSDLGARLILQVHDELLFEVDKDRAEEAAARACELMQSVRPGGVSLSVPLLVEAGMGHNWGEAH